MYYSFYQSDREKLALKYTFYGERKRRGLFAVLNNSARYLSERVSGTAIFPQLNLSRKKQWKIARKTLGDLFFHQLQIVFLALQRTEKKRKEMKLENGTRSKIRAKRNFCSLDPPACCQSSSHHLPASYHITIPTPNTHVSCLADPRSSSIPV